MSTKSLMKLTKKELVRKINELNILLKSTPSDNDATNIISSPSSTVESANINVRLTKLENIISEVIDENKNLKDSITDINEENKVIIDELQKSQKDLYSLQQYIRWNNIEICNIPEEVPQNDLKDRITQALNQMDVPVKNNDIEACHRLYKNKNVKSPANVIVRFLDRSFAFDTLKNKKKAKEVDNNIFGNNINLFFKENLCPHYKDIYNYCSEKRDNGEIVSCWTYKGICHILFSDDPDESPTKIYHYDELWDLFDDDD